MEFKRAWENRMMLVDEIKSKTKREIEVLMTFESGTATMLMPLFFDDIEGSKGTLEKSWITFCKTHPEKLNTIADIIVYDRNGQDVYDFDRHTA